MLSGAESAYAAAAATVTTVSLSSTTVTAGAPILATVTVTSGGNPVPSGLVFLCTNYTEFCSGSEAYAVLHLSPNGTASTNVYSVGGTGIQAGFAGNSVYAKSLSGKYGTTPTFTNANIPTFTSLTSSGSVGKYTLNATMTRYSTPSGSSTSQPISFINTSNGNSVLGTSDVTGSSQVYQFVAGTVPTVGTQSGYVVSGDFNHDGRTDLAVVNTGDNTVSILLSNGDGTFQPQVTYPTGNAPGPIVTGYFNADGNLDLAVVNTTDRSITLLFGNDAGIFTPQAPTYATGANPNALVAGDLDGDGITDLVMLNHDDRTVGVLLNHGDGTFKAQVTYATGNDPRSIDVGDPNNDGFQDIAVANFADNTLSLLYGKGDGTLQDQTTMATGNGPIAVSLADMDDTGFSSISYLNYTDNTLTVLARQYASGAIVPATYHTGNGPRAFIYGYAFDRTLAASPAVINSDGTLSIFPTDGEYEGGLVDSPATYSIPVGAVSLAAGNFNGDQDLDFFVGGTSTAAPVLYLQRETYTASYTLSGVSVPGISTSSVIANYPGALSLLGGDPALLPSSSDPVTLTDSPILTTTVLVLGPNHGVAPGGTDVLTATVTPILDENYSATGTITFTDGGTVVCGAVPIVNGVAACTTGTLGIAQHVFGAIYSGNTYFAGSAASTRVLNVSNFSTTRITLTAPGYSDSNTTVALGTPVTASVIVTDTAGVVNGGVVNLCEATAVHCTGTNLLGKVQLQTANGSAPGTGTMALLLPLGTHNVQAVSLGTVSDAASTSSPKPLTVFSPATSTTALTSTGSAGNYKLTATVTSSNIVPITSGTIAIADSSNATFSKTGTLATSSSYSNSLIVSSKSYAGLQDTDSIGVIKDIHLADLNGDGVQDMVYPNYNYGTIGVRFGNHDAVVTGRGDGTFATTETQYGLTANPVSSPTAMAVADLNGDGKPDLIVADDGADVTVIPIANIGSIYILLNHGDGTYPSSSAIAVDAAVNTPNYSIGPDAVAVGDFNGDGKPDIAVGTDEGTVYILLGNGDGTFQTPILCDPNRGGVFVTGLTVADMNGDGFLDLVYTDVFGGQASVMLGNGDGTFLPAINNLNTNSDAGYGLAVADVNNDGIPDVVLALGDVEIMIGNGDGTFQDATSLNVSNYDAYAVNVADFNGDGVLDIAVSLENSVAIFLGQSTTTVNGDGTFTFSPKGTFGSSKKTTISHSGENLHMDVGDVNGDGVPDLVVNSQDYGTNYILFGKAQSTASTSIPSVSVPGSATAANHSLIASYPGDTFHTGSVSPALHLAGTLIPTTTTISISPSSGSTYGTTTTVSAMISPTVESSYTLGGTTTFKDVSTALTSTAAVTSNASSYAYIPSGGSHSFSAVYAGDTNFKTSTSTSISDTVVTATPTITWIPSSHQGTARVAIGNAILNASSAAAGTFAYTATPLGGSESAITAASTLAAGSYTLTANFTPTVSSNYGSASSSISFMVLGAQAITFTPPASVVFGSGPLTLAGTSSSGLAVSYAVSGPAVLVHGNTLYPTGLGSIVVMASQAGDASNAAAVPVVQPIAITPATFTSVMPSTLAQGSSVTTFVTLHFNASFTLGSLTVTSLSSGTPFTALNTGSCLTGSNYNLGDTCTVDVQFTASEAGVPAATINAFDNTDVPLLQAATNVIAVRYR